MTRRVMFYVQHLLGVGHVARAAAIARAMVAEGLDVRVVLGGEPVSQIDFGSIETVQLAPIRTLDIHFTALVDVDGNVIDIPFQKRRRDALLSAYGDFRPDVLLVEHFPFGRRQLSFELLPLFETARSDGCAIACSVRDILVAKSDPGKIAKITKLARAWLDQIYVHGDPVVATFGETFFGSADIEHLIAYTGYVTSGGNPAATPPGNDGVDEIIVSIGGGAVGVELLETALAAALKVTNRDAGDSLHRGRWRLLAGPNLAQDRFEAMQAAAISADQSRIIVERARPDFCGLLARCALSVSQAGYNTLMDVMTARCRSVMVPFAGGHETEQQYRAIRFARRGLISLVDEDNLTPETLVEAIDQALQQPRPDTVNSGLDMTGAQTTARRIATLSPRR